MKLEDIKPNMRVAYVPLHAEGDVLHRDTEYGIVFRVVGRTGVVFVKFDDQLTKLGWDEATLKGCRADDLVELVVDKPLGDDYPYPCNSCIFNWMNPKVRDWYCQREEKRPKDPMMCEKFKLNKSI